MLTLDDVKVNRRQFLELVAATVVGTYTGWKPQVHIPAFTPQLFKDMPPKERCLFLYGAQMWDHGEYLSSLFTAPFDAQGDAKLTLLWTGPTSEFGLWLDAFMIHENPLFGENLTIRRIIYESIAEFESPSEGLVNRANLGAFPIEPAQVYCLGLKSPLMSWYDDGQPTGVLGIEVSYKA